MLPGQPHVNLMRTACSFGEMATGSEVATYCDPSHCTFPACVWSNTIAEEHLLWGSVTDPGRLAILLAAAVIAIRHGDDRAFEAAVHLSSVPEPVGRH